MRRWGRRVVAVAGLLALLAALVWWTSPWTASRLDAVYPQVLFDVETSDSLVALTLDDGPSDATPRLLELLERHDARATFFVLRKVRPGAIVVLHDGEERGERTAAVLERVLPELRARGYRVVSLSRLAREAR